MQAKTLVMALALLGAALCGLRIKNMRLVDDQDR
jgi:hypothetical protein